MVSSASPRWRRTVTGVRRVGVVEQRELGVTEHEGVVALRDEEGAAEIEPGGLEGAAVDDAGEVLERVDAQPGPRQVGEGEPGDDARARSRRRPPPRGAGSTVRSATAGLPGTAYATSACSAAAATTVSTMAR